MIEEWREVLGYELQYEVSSLGRIRSKNRIVSGAKGSKQLIKAKMLKPCRYKSDRPTRKYNENYLYVDLCKDGKRKRRSISHLVLEAFVGRKPPDLECRHLNGKSDDNNIENLAWGTKKENGEDRIKHGTTPIGEKAWKCKLTDEDVKNIIKRRAGGETAKSIWKDYPFVSKEYIWRVCYNQRAQRICKQ